MWKKIMSYGALLALVQLVMACGEGQDAKADRQAASEKQREAAGNDGDEQVNGALVVAFGDSLFAGYQLDREQGFAPVLEESLAQMGRPAKVFNAGVSGDTSAGGLQRLAFVLDGLPKKPDLVIVELGANDMLRGLEPERTRSNLTAIMDELDARGIESMLAGMVAAPNMGGEYADAFNAIYPDLAERYDVPLYPFVLEGVAGNEKLLLADGLHPNPQGVETMVSGIAPMVVSALKD